MSSEGLFALAVLDAAAGRYAVAGNGRAVVVVEGGAVVDAFPIGHDVWDLAVADGDLVAAGDDG
jgi:hypothetical protein